MLVAETGEEPQPAALHVGILLSLMGGCCWIPKKYYCYITSLVLE